VRPTNGDGKVVGKGQLQIDGQIMSVAAPPNQVLDCTGTLSKRPTAPITQFGPVGDVWNRTYWRVDAFAPDSGPWVQSSADPDSNCGNTPNSASPSPPCGPSIQPVKILRPSALPYVKSGHLQRHGELTERRRELLGIRERDARHLRLRRPVSQVP
jgi:hypothetical protein